MPVSADTEGNEAASHLGSTEIFALANQSV
jgi:hypothetical protein